MTRQSKKSISFHRLHPLWVYDAANLYRRVFDDRESISSCIRRSRPLAAIEDVRTAESEEEVEEPVSHSTIDNDTIEDGSEKEVDDDSAYDMDGGVLEVDDVNYDFDEEDRNECNHDTDLIDANVMNNDEPEGRTRSIRRKVVPSRLKECMF